MDAVSEIRRFIAGDILLKRFVGDIATGIVYVPLMMGLLVRESSLCTSLFWSLGRRTPSTGECTHLWTHGTYVLAAGPDRPLRFDLGLRLSKENCGFLSIWSDFALEVGGDDIDALGFVFVVEVIKWWYNITRIINQIVSNNIAAFLTDNNRNQRDQSSASVISLSRTKCNTVQQNYSFE